MLSQSKIVVHCGVQKTASTAFHHLVQRNRGLLAEHLEIHTPVKGSAMRDMGRVAALYSLGDSSEADFVGQIEKMRDLLTGGTKTVLLSHENLPGAMLGRQGVVELYPHLEQILSLIDENLAPFSPHYVFHTRDMPAWKQSVYNQAVRSDSYASTYDEFLAETANCGSWDLLEKRVAGQVGANRVTFFKVEDEPDRDLPGLRLLKLCGVPESVLNKLKPVSGKRNESLNDAALEFMRRMNGLQLPQSERRKMAKLIAESEPLFWSGAEQQ